MFSTKLLLSLAGLLLINLCQAQNLVPNPGFENGSCVVNYNSTASKIPTTLDNWYSANGASPDPFDICGTMQPAAYDIIVPDILMGYQYARTGNRFMGFGFYTSWYEYIGTKLTEPLEAGETYKVKFWVACGDMMLWAAPNIGMYFSTTEIKYPGVTSADILNYTPQVSATNSTGTFLTDTLWQEVTGEFVAAGGEQWIVIGYFKPMNNSDFYLFPDPGDGRKRKANPDYKPTLQGTGTTTGPRLYYYIDDVSVEKVSSLPIKLSAFSGRMTNQQAQLQWRTETESNNCRFEIERSANGSNFTLAGTVPGAVNSSTPKQYGYTDVSPLPGRSYYRIRQVDCDGKSSYSRVISLQNDPAGFTIYPNPVADAITIDRNRAGQVQATVYDLAGRALIAQRISNVRERVSAVGLVPGTYIIKVESGSGTVTQKFIKK